MLNKRKLNYDYKRLRKIHPIFLLVLALFFLGLGIYGLRSNNFQMAKLREKVAVADEQNGDVETVLRELRQFVYSHMNTNLTSGDLSIKPPIQLKHRYDRLAAAEAERVKSINNSMRAQAESSCTQQYPGKDFNSERVNCVADYIRTHTVPAHEIPSDLYKFDFISPAWSPDLAGISLLLALIFFAALTVRLAVGLWYRFELK